MPLRGRLWRGRSSASWAREPVELRNFVPWHRAVTRGCERARIPNGCLDAAVSTPSRKRHTTYPGASPGLLYNLRAVARVVFSRSRAVRIFQVSGGWGVGGAGRREVKVASQVSKCNNRTNVKAVPIFPGRVGEIGCIGPRSGLIRFPFQIPRSFDPFSIDPITAEALSARVLLAPRSRNQSGADHGELDNGGVADY